MAAADKAAWIKLYTDRPLSQPRRQFMLESSTSYSTLMSWLRDPVFKAQIELADEQRRQLTLAPAEEHIELIVSKMVELAAAGGNVAAAQLILRACGYLNEKQQATTNNNLAVLIQRVQQDEPKTIEAAFEVIDARYAELQRARALVEAENTQTGEPEGADAETGVDPGGA